MSAATRISLSWPCLPNHCWIVASGALMMLAPPVEAGNLMTPEMRAGCRPVDVATCTCWPTFRCLRLARPLSTARSGSAAVALASLGKLAGNERGDAEVR